MTLTELKTGIELEPQIALKRGRAVIPAWIGLGLVIIAAFVVRLYLLLKSGWMIDYDEALIGLMGIDIMNGQRPVFINGVPYMGALQPYLASLLFSLVGISAVALKLIPLGMSLVWVGTTYLLARRLWGNAAGLLAAAVAAAPPLYVLSNTLKAWGGTIEVMALGNLILTASIALATESSARRRLHWWVGLGFTIGVAMWLYWLVAYYVVAAGLYLLLRRPQRLLSAEWLMAVPSFLVGSMLFWAYNIRHEWATFRYLLGEGKPPSSGAGRLATAWDMVTNLIPRVLGAQAPEPVWLAGAGAVAAGIAILALLVGIMLWRRGRGSEAVAVFILSVPVLYLVSGYGAPAVNGDGIDTSGRYLVPFFAATPLAAAYVSRQMTRVGGMVLASIIILASIAGLAGADGAQVFQSPYYNRVPVSLEPLVEALRRHGIDRVWTDVGLGQPLMFVSQRAILAADFRDRTAGGIVRFPASYAAVQGAERAAYVVATLPGQVGPLEREFQQLGVEYAKEEVGTLTILMPSRRVWPGEVAAGLGYQY